MESKKVKTGLFIEFFFISIAKSSLKDLKTLQLKSMWILNLLDL